MKIGRLYDNPTLLLLNPNKGGFKEMKHKEKVAKEVTKEVAKKVARHRRHHKILGEYSAPRIRHVIFTNDPDPDPGQILKIGGGVLIGGVVAEIVPNLITKYSSSISPMVSKLVGAGVGALGGYAVVKYAHEEDLGLGIMAGSVVDAVLNIVKEKMPSLLLQPALPVTTTTMPAALPAATKGMEGVEGMTELSGLTVLQGGLGEIPYTDEQVSLNY